MREWESLEEYEASFGDEVDAQPAPPPAAGRPLAATLIVIASLVLAPVAYVVIAFLACFAEECSGEEPSFAIIPVFIVAAGIAAAIAVGRVKPR